MIHVHFINNQKTIVTVPICSDVNRYVLAVVKKSRTVKLSSNSLSFCIASSNFSPNIINKPGGNSCLNLETTLQITDSLFQNQDTKMKYKNLKIMPSLKEVDKMLKNRSR